MTARPVFLNTSKAYSHEPRNLTDVAKFHAGLPGFADTPLVPLAGVANELGIKKLYVKSEISRLGLPAFKILGASWGAFRAIASKLQLPTDSTLEIVGEAAQKVGITIYAATEGNHGRAVARFASMLGIKAVIYVRRGMVQPTKDLIAGEGADLKIIDGTYDDAVAEANKDAKSVPNGVLVQDNAFEGYEDVPQWIVDGYSTMLQEIDQQLSPEIPTIVIVPVGVGSLAQAVVSHYKSQQTPPLILTVEPDTGACLYKSLIKGQSIPILTYSTIMAGMRCETVSSIAWSILQAGVDAAVTVSDFEVHESIQALFPQDVRVGPCGAAAYAALLKVARTNPSSINLGPDSVVVLISTEGYRDYTIPRDISKLDDAVSLTQTLVQIDSSNPGLSKAPGAGETEIADFVAAWLEHRDIETHWVDVIDEAGRSRPSVIGVVRGSGGGKTIMFNGHIDTVSTASYSPDEDPIGGEIREGKLYGRGSGDMKSGIAAAMVSLARAKEAALRGDVILAAVADEENTSLGTEAILKAGWRADGAVVGEPTHLAAFVGHKGFIWVEVDILGVAAHGSMPDLGVDAISKAGHFLVALEKYGEELLNRPPHALLGTASVHVGLIAGGEEPSSYPSKCTVTIERRTIAGETEESVLSEITALLQGITTKDFKHSPPRITFSRAPYEADRKDPFIVSALKSIEDVLGEPPFIGAMTAWTDCALLAEKGIPALLFGVEGGGYHSAKEWAVTDGISKTADVMTKIMLDFCK